LICSCGEKAGHYAELGGLALWIGCPYIALQHEIATAKAKGYGQRGDVAQAI
jgi:hypothetical protein